MHVRNTVRPSAEEKNEQNNKGTNKSKAFKAHKHMM